MYIDASRTSGVSAGMTVLMCVVAGAIMALETGARPPLIDQRIEKNRNLPQLMELETGHLSLIEWRGIF